MTECSGAREKKHQAGRMFPKYLDIWSKMHPLYFRFFTAPLNNLWNVNSLWLVGEDKFHLLFLLNISFSSKLFLPFHNLPWSSSTPE